MIKLFWNTHSQNKSELLKSQDKKKWSWGYYHKKNSDKWIHEVLSKIKYKSIQSIDEIESNDILIIADSSVEKKIELYTKLNLICSKVFLIHLGDEAGTQNLTSIYQKCSYVWRTFCSSKYFNNNHVACIPIGYKSGTVKKEIKRRKYKWSFVGTAHKSSRHDLLFQLKNIQPFFQHKTEKFNEKIIEVNEMSEILSSTEFMPCPNGFFHPETYRLYEALECGCIPIVENAYKYYDRLFPNNPFLKIDKWSEAGTLIKTWNQQQIIKKQEECVSWWSKYKQNLQNFIEKKLEANG